MLKIDGGMGANDWMAQDLADMLGLPVERPDFVETTALGAAMLAAVGAGLFIRSLEAARGDVAARRGGSSRRWQQTVRGRAAGRAGDAALASV